MTLENTDEYNRGFRLLNQAGLDPYRDQPIPNQQPLDLPRTDEELYNVWQSFIKDDTPPFIEDDAPGFFVEEHEMEHVLDDYLANEEYHPFQIIVEDTQEGFDLSGDYHAIPAQQTALEGLGQAITPYRWASYLEDAVQQLCQGNDYHTGRAERCDMAEQIFNDRLARAATEQEQIALQEALQVWYRSYGHGN